MEIKNRFSVTAERKKRSFNREVLKKAIEAKRSDKRLHFAYTQVLLKEQSDNTEEVIYHLERSFGPGDSNYRARLLLGKQFYMCGRVNDSKGVFRQLDKARVSPFVRNRIQEPLDGRFNGRVIKLEANY